jgi:hypothetical protein
MAVQFKIYDSAGDNALPEYPAVEVGDSTTIEFLGYALGLPLTRERGGQDGEGMLGRALLALGIYPDKPAEEHSQALIGALRNLADMATDAYLGNYMVAWA